MLVVNRSTATLYQTPEKGAHVEDVLRYATPVVVREEKGGWAAVFYEGWQGWLLREQLLEVLDLPSHAFASFRGAYLFYIPDTEWGPFFYLPFEAPIEVIEECPEQHNRWLKVKLLDGQIGFVQRSQLVFSRPRLPLLEAVAFSKNFLGINYLYGGTTSLGYDCSGFVQMIYRQMGILLPRNSYQQAVDSRLVEVEEAAAGDFVFFSNSSGKVTHVAMMIDREEFIHAFTKQEAWICLGKLSNERWRNGHFYHGVQVKRFAPLLICN